MNLYFIHRFGEKITGSIHIINDLYFGGDFDQLLDLIESTEKSDLFVRFFIGYSGWGENQLEEELMNNSWIVANDFNTESLMQTNNDDLWKEMMAKQGTKFKLLADSPLNPENN